MKNYILVAGHRITVALKVNLAHTIEEFVCQKILECQPVHVVRHEYIYALCVIL